MYCTICKKNNIDFYYHDKRELGEEDFIWGKTNLSGVNGGISQKIEAGYGSTHDGDVLHISICDECIYNGIEDSTILYVKNILYRNDDDTEDAKVKYRRKSNLDKLTKDDDNN